MTGKKIQGRGRWGGVEEGKSGPRRGGEAPGGCVRLRCLIWGGGELRLSLGEGDELESPAADVTHAGCSDHRLGTIAPPVAR